MLILKITNVQTYYINKHVLLLFICVISQRNTEQTKPIFVSKDNIFNSRESMRFLILFTAKKKSLISVKMFMTSTMLRLSLSKPIADTYTLTVE